MLNNEPENGETHESEMTTGQSRGNRENCAFLAGFFEGEGSFFFLNANPTQTLNVWLSVGGCCLPLIERVQAIIQEITFRKYEIKERRTAAQKHVFYEIRVMDQKGCRKVCEAMLPYLVGKKEQAKAIITFCLVRKAAKHSGQYKSQGPVEAALHEQFLAAKSGFYTTGLGPVSTERLAPIPA